MKNNKELLGKLKNLDLLLRDMYFEDDIEKSLNTARSILGAIIKEVKKLV